MKKILSQGILIVISFALLWFSLSRIDWISLFAIKKATAKTEEKLGKLFWEIFEKNEKENKDPYVSQTIDSIVGRICDANEIERNSLKIHILIKDDVNAFALPDGHLVIHTGLILSSENAEALCGVIAHEIAHIQQKHVMKKLIKEVGLSVLISMTTGGGGAEAAKDAIRILSSSAFDRTLEKEADIVAVDYMMKANVDPEDFANFLYMIAETEEKSDRFLTWMSTHPDSKERGNYIIAYAKGKNAHYRKIIDDSTWGKMIRTIQNK